MKKTIGAIALGAILLGGCVTPQPTPAKADGQVPDIRIYLLPLTQAAPGLVEVRFERAGGVIFDTTPLEVSFNDVVLASIQPHEHFSIWLKPGVYRFGVRQMTSLTDDQRGQSEVTVDVQAGGAYRLRPAGTARGAVLQLIN